MEKGLVAAIGANFTNVSAPETSAKSERQPFPEDKFVAWLDEDSTPALISESHGRYHAYCFEFGIAGSGATKDEAVSDAVNLLMRYLAVCFSEGRPYKESKKSAPVSLRLRSWYLFLRAKLLRKIKPLSRLGWLTSVPTTNRGSHRLAH